MIHFNWTQLIVNQDHLHVATAILASVFLIAISFYAKKALGLGEAAIVPAAKFSVKAFFEFITEFIVSVSDTVIGKQGRKFVPLFASLFFFILINNLLGLFPGMTPATENINTTVAVGLFSLFAYNVYGFKEHGLSYLKQFLGPIIWLTPLMIFVELIGHILRPLSLGLRLQGNMVGDHTVLGIFVELLPVWLPVPMIFYGLGVFVCCMQAFVFTMLSMVYVSMSISHDH